MLTKEKNKRRTAKWRADNPEKARRQQLWHKFKITLEQYKEMLLAQNYCCLICQKHASEQNKQFAVDHCHTHKHIRGLLCNTCNVGLGAFHDDPILLAKAIAYLEEKKYAK